MERNVADIDMPHWLERVKGVLETLNEGVVIADGDDRVLFANPFFAEMTGVPRGDAIGRNALQLYCDPRDYAAVQELRKRTTPEGRSRGELFLLTHDGRRLPVIVSVRSVQDADGRRYAIATFVDISEQRQAQEELRSAYAQLEERQKEIEQDLRLAARVQQSLAPKSLVWGCIRVDTSYHPTRTIGGDFGLVVPIETDQLNLLVCDVVGHGIGSALIANRIYAEATMLLSSRPALPDMLRHLNRLAIQDIGSPGFFFTLAAARIDRSGRHMVFAGAGHPPAMVVSPGEEPRLLKSQSTILGALPGAVDREAATEVDLAPGDRIVLYTDGITDVFDSRGEMLGVEGLQRVVRETSLLPFTQMKQAILDRVAAWRAGPPVDDVSLVLVEVG
jgi:PAS domain S-box-containing protein